MWYAIWTETGKEKEAAAELAFFLPEESFKSCWVPTRVVRLKRRGVLKDVEKALFPGYFFIDCDDPGPVIKIIRKLERFRIILKQGGVYTPITPEEEKLIRRLTDRHGRVNVSLCTMNEDGLHVMDGPLKNMEPYIKKVDLHRLRVLVELDMFGKKHSFWAAVEMV
ncbi:MAG: hypothetical protein IKI75_08185 [Lachnospiraceae bacterium]|nr:hypothetical protein [Lachnospiraceae bacterium]